MRFKIEKGVSRINRVKLQASIDEPVAAELALMCEWSNNDRNYVVNALLRFALSQDGEFQAYKESLASSGLRKGPTLNGFRTATNRNGSQVRFGCRELGFWCSSNSGT